MGLPAVKPKIYLTAKEQAFVQAYLENGGRADHAALAAYGVNGLRQGDRIMALPQVQAAIAYAEAESSRQVAAVIKRHAMTKARLTDIISTMVTYDLRKAVQIVDGKIRLKPIPNLSDDEAQALQGLEIKADGSVKVIFASKLEAAALLAKLAGWLIDRKETRIIRGPADLTDEELDALTMTEVQPDEFELTGRFPNAAS